MNSLNNIEKFRILHIVNHLVAIIAIYMAVSAGEWYWFAIGLIAFLWFGIVGVNVALHRYYTHRAFKTTPFREWILLLSTVPTSLGSPAMWCSVHRVHHLTSDGPGDPHDPRNGIFKTWFTIWPKILIPKRHIVPFLKTSAMRFIHKNYFFINFGILIVLAIIDIKLAGFLYALPAIGCFHGAVSISVIPHLTGKWQLGYRRYNTSDSSHNNWLASILSLGEGWHNNHHANPGNWKQGETSWEIDPPAFMIKNFFMISEKSDKKS